MAKTECVEQVKALFDKYDAFLKKNADIFREQDEIVGDIVSNPGVLRFDTEDCSWKVTTSAADARIAELEAELKKRLNRIADQDCANISLINENVALRAQLERHHDVSRELALEDQIEAMRDEVKDAKKERDADEKLMLESLNHAIEVDKENEDLRGRLTNSGMRLMELEREVASLIVDRETREERKRMPTGSRCADCQTTKSVSLHVHMRGVPYLCPDCARKRITFVPAPSKKTGVLRRVAGLAFKASAVAGAAVAGAQAYYHIAPYFGR